MSHVANDIYNETLLEIRKEIDSHKRLMLEIEAGKQLHDSTCDCDVTQCHLEYK